MDYSIKITNKKYSINLQKKNFGVNTYKRSYKINLQKVLFFTQVIKYSKLNNSFIPSGGEYIF